MNRITSYFTGECEMAVIRQTMYSYALIQRFITWIWGKRIERVQAIEGDEPQPHKH